LQVGLQLLQEPLLAANSTSTNGASSCQSGTAQHKAGDVVSGITLNNGFTSSIRGFQYRCTNGRWVFERTASDKVGTSTSGALFTSPPLPRSSTTATTSSPTRKHCYGNARKIYNEGDRISSRLVLGFGRMPRNKDKDEFGSKVSQVECKAGKWVPVKVQSCRHGAGGYKPQGATSSNPYKFGSSSPLDRTWEKLGPYKCNNGNWTPDRKATTTKPVACSPNQRIGYVSSGSGSTSSFAGLLPCRN
jgi:hypothetical protein